MAFPTACAFKLLTFLNLARASLPESRPRRSPAMLLPTLHTAVLSFAQVFIPLGLPAPRGKATLLSLTPQHQAWHHGHL